MCGRPSLHTIRYASAASTCVAVYRLSTSTIACHCGKVARHSIGQIWFHCALRVTRPRLSASRQAKHSRRLLQARSSHLITAATRWGWGFNCDPSKGADKHGGAIQRLNPPYEFNQIQTKTMVRRCLGAGLGSEQGAPESNPSLLRPLLTSRTLSRQLRHQLPPHHRAMRSRSSTCSGS